MSTKKRIMLVDDEVDLREALTDQFAIYDEFDVVGIENGADAIKQAKAEEFDLIILDVGLPDFDGREVCRMLRKSDIKVPIIMLTGASTDADTILGLDSGANDYVTKPFNFSILMARVRAHLRMYEQSEDAVLTVGPYRFRPAQKILEFDDKSKIRLTEKEANILKYLYRAEEKSVTREELLNDVWGYNAGVTTHTLETHIYRLRQKIEVKNSAKRIIITEQGGYRLNRHY